ncbi:hypothetical protein EDB92DRAFT_1958238 [Lactarius akahatsu]|uniref:Uncharacterized protein n=1 Tax=Lactarius akahatsu TaxID=416441 RepID=A0AAD4L771_9AGAM|nr:hypothetical protein EDB92DRAFT_1958238 [Lactarius akahatsu]
MREARDLLIQEERECIHLQGGEMQEIKDAVKAEIFANLNQEALQNLDKWQAVYKHEFVEAMHDTFKAQYPGIHPNRKGKCPTNTPAITHSQVVREAEPCIREEVQCLVNEHITMIHQEIQVSLMAEDPFWTKGPLWKTIANKIRSTTNSRLKEEMKQELLSLKQLKDQELKSIHQQLIFEHEETAKEWHTKNQSKINSMKTFFKDEATTSLEEWKKGVQAEIKAWKVKYHNGCELSTLHHEALGAADYKLAPLEVDGIELSSSPPSRAASPAPPFPTTLPTATSFVHHNNPNTTPTPVRVKRTHVDGPTLPPLTIYPAADNEPQGLHTTTPHEIQSCNEGIWSSIHAPTASQSPILVHTPNAPLQVAALTLQAEQPTTVRPPSPVLGAPPQLADPTPAPLMAAPIDGLTVVLAALNATILRLKHKINSGLYAQSKCINTLSTSCDPRCNICHGRLPDLGLLLGGNPRKLIVVVDEGVCVESWVRLKAFISSEVCVDVF